jgi:dipeptidyl aminopeptidase/acylaminoacyl peptidase
MKSTIAVLFLGAMFLSACTEGRADAHLALAANAGTVAVADTGQVPVFRRVWDQAPPYVKPSSDGRYLVHTGSNVTIIDLVTGQEQRITPERWDNDWAEAPYFSPDGRSVAYLWGERPPGPTSYSLKMVEIGDTIHETLLTTGDTHLGPGEDLGIWWGIMDWTENEGMLLEVDDGRFALATFRPGDEAPHVLWRFEEGDPDPSNQEFSPDGRFVAYNLGENIFTIPSGGGEPVDPGIGPGQVMGWTQTGELVVYTPGPGAGGIWSVPMDDGRAVGDGVLLKGDVHGLAPLDPSDDAFFYTLTVDVPKIFAATIDIESGGFVVAPTPVTSIADGVPGPPQWSPDGRSFVYTQDIPTPRSYSRRKRDIVLQSWDGRDRRVLTTLETEIRQLMWDPDGESVLFRSGQALFRVDLLSGRRTTVIDVTDDEELAGLFPVHMTPDGRSLVGVVGTWNSSRSLVAVDPETRALRTLATFLLPDWRFSRATVSPDGRNVAVRVSGPNGGPSALFVVPFEGGEPREILHVEDPFPAGLRGYPAWTPDSETILAGLGQSVVAIPATGGQYRVVLDQGPGRQMSLHPDGRRVLWLDGEFVAEIWTMEQVPSIRR